MKTVRTTVVAVLLLLVPWFAYASTNAAEAEHDDFGVSEVRSFPLFGNAYNWRALSDDSLIVWTTPSRPYLLQLNRRSPELKFKIGIGLTSFGGRVSAKFDDVVVDGWKYPIKAIYQLDRDTAKILVSNRQRTL
jgi:Family of unknown function (DUF6491)